MQVKTATHVDNAFGAIKRAIDTWYHSPEASEPWNPKHEMVRVDCGRDQKTGERLYTLHPRRAQLRSARRSLPIFRRSSMASALRAATRVEPVYRNGKLIRKGRPGVKVTWRHFREGKCAPPSLLSIKYLPDYSYCCLLALLLKWVGARASSRARRRSACASSAPT